jgi:hypothetical protein
VVLIRTDCAYWNRDFFPRAGMVVGLAVEELGCDEE